MRYRYFTLFALLAIVRCGSLLNELERIKNKATPTTVASPTQPRVLYTVPADGTVSAPVQNYIDIVFDQAIDSASVTSPQNSDTCALAAVASYNDFANCGGTASVSGSTLRLGISTMPRGVVIKVRATAIRGANGLVASNYESPIGFSFTTPCGQHCFYSDSAPLSGVTSAGSSNFYVTSGTHAGKQIIVHGGSTGTTLYDPSTNQTATGPTLAGALSPNVGSHNFIIPSGTNAGHVMLYQGNGTNATNRYDMSTGAFVSGPTTGTNVATGAVTFQATAGTYNGRMVTAVGGSLATAISYNNGTNTFGAGPGVGAMVAAGAHGYRLDSGPQAGQFRLLVGGNTTARYYDDASDTWNAITNSNCIANVPSSFQVFQGAQAGKFYQICGGGNTTNLYDQNVTSVSGLPMPLGANASAITVPFSSGSSNNGYLVFSGNASNTTMIYTASTDTWALGPLANNLQNTGSTYFNISAGTHSGKQLIMLGNSSGRTAMFDPATSKFSGTRPFSSVAIGANYFKIKTGIHAGKVMIVGAGGLSGTSLYDPESGEMSVGPNTVGTTGDGSNNIALTSGPHSGKTFLINAQLSTNSQLYDPASNSFSASAVAGVFSNNVGGGAKNFAITSGPQTGNFLILNGNGATTTNYYNPLTHTLSAGPAICGVTTGSLTFTIPSDGFFPGDQFIVCGGINTYRFDPTTPGVIAGASLPMGATGAGSSVIYLRTGIHAGKFLIIHAGGTMLTTLYQPSNDTLAAGPSTTACTNIGIGSVSFEITAGANKGKFIITLGALTPQTCIYDPATNTFAFGPDIGPHPGYGTTDGTVAFATGGGLYPTAYVIVHGGFFGAFSHYFQY